MFNTVREYVRFAAAREFWHAEDDEGGFGYQKTTIEKIGDVLLPGLKLSDGALKRIREPSVIVVSTIAALSIATVMFYPEKCTEVFLRAFPVASMIKPWAVKLAVFVVAELHIIGLGLRTYGRLDNAPLMQAWRNKTVLPIPIGAVPKT